MTIKHKVFAAYSVLKAADVNEYLMNQVAVELDTVGELSSVPSGVDLVRINGGQVFSREGGSVWKQIGTARQRDYSASSSGDRIRIASGYYVATFSAISYTYNTIDFTDMGFTAPPHIVGSPTDGGSNGPITVHFSALSATGTSAVTRATGNISGSIGVNWIAIGV
jgi:hypothetical protein